MKKAIQLSCLTFCFLFFSPLLWRGAGGEAAAQSPLVKQWDYRFGGTASDYLNNVQQTSDGGFILGGDSYSGISGDKTQPSWGYNDYWIVKIDSNGNKLWDKNFGGTEYDFFLSSQQTSDGGYIIGGSSTSGISGDKTQPVWGTSGIDYDYWIVKIDSLGNKQWDKDFGGTGDDFMLFLRQTSDGGYILGGHSKSGINGDKTQASWGDFDYWIVKIDSLGNKQWDKDFGGLSTENLYSLTQTTDGGYLIGGASTSYISGNKTQATWGGYDYWIVKTDSLGNKLWDKDLGGTEQDYLHSLVQTTDGSYILGGFSFSGVGGDKTQPNWSANYGDYWLIKTDSLGNKLWDKDFGGTLNEELFTISSTADGGYLIGGDSYSPISGNKTENNLGLEQGWLVKTDSLGTIQWDKTILTGGHDENGNAIQTTDGCYVYVNYTLADSGGHKSQISQGQADYWIIKFCDSTLTSGITSTLYKEEAVQVFPNPASESTTVDYSSLKEKVISVSIKNILGETVSNYVHIPENRLLIQTAVFPKGIYFIELNTGKNIFQKKLVVQ